MITVAFCTPDVSKDTEFIKNLLDKALGNIEIIAKTCTKQNGKTICQAYNEVLNEALNDTIIFCHNDIHILTDKYDLIVECLFENNKDYGIIGTVGGTKWTRGSWLGDGGQALGTLVLFSKYKIEKNLLQPLIILFSPLFRLYDLVRSVTVDGMFICCRRDRIKSKFDDNLKGFHFYDVMFAVDNFDLGVKVGVTYLIDISHYSDGFYNQDWYETKLYADCKYLNKTFEVKLPINGGLAISLYYMSPKSIEQFRKRYYVRDLKSTTFNQVKL